jgi:succinate dehydrogenase / fumarate reductase, cytochrome b subunit
MNSEEHSCQCGGHPAAAPRKNAGIPVPILAEESHQCGCGGHGHHSSENAHAGHHHHEGCGCGGGGVCPRKYHSVAGLILAAWLLVHFVISFLGFWPEHYQTLISTIHRYKTPLIAIEILFIGVPLLVHIGYGLRFLLREGITLPREKHHYATATRFFWQRVSAIVLLLFVVFHVATLHQWGFHLVYKLTHWSALQRYSEGGIFVPDNAYASTVEGVSSFWNASDPSNPGNVIVVTFYLLAVLAAVYHLANGIATSAMVWDITPDDSPAANRLWSYCKVAAIGLLVLGAGSWWAFARGV